MWSVFFEMASPAEGLQRLHKNTDYAHLWGFSRPFCLTLQAEGPQCSAERLAEGPKVGFRVFRVFRVLGCLGCLECLGCLGVFRVGF